MSAKNDLLKNSTGGTLIGILIALAIVGVLVHPKTSPFKNVYFDYQAQTTLKEVQKACKSFWASEITGAGNSGSAGGMDFDAAMSANVFTSKVKGNTTPLSDCTLEIVSEMPYNFKPRSDVKVTIVDGSNDLFEATARHTLGETTHKIDAQGNLS